MIEDSVPKLVTTRPEAEIAADLKKRFEEAMGPALEIMDEAIKAGAGNPVRQHPDGPAAVPQQGNEPSGRQAVLNFSPVT